MGHSMLPILPPRTLVFGWSYFRKVKPGQVVVLEHDGIEKVKRIDQVKDGKVYVLGDYLAASTDSRHFGWIPLALVKAIIIWPRTKPRES